MDDITAYICSMIVEGQHGAVVFRVSKGFEAVLEEGVVTPSTLGWVLDIVIAAVSSGRLSTNYQASTSPNVREVTKRIYLLLKTFLATPETDRKGLTEMMMQLFAFCAPDVYFLDYITQSKFMHTPDGAHVWREMMQEMLMQVQDGDLDGSRLPHVACLLTFTKYLMKHGPSGPHAVFNAWNISPVALLRVADQYIASTVEISSLELDVAENMLGELACGALISVLNAKPVSKISPGPRDMISTISMIVKITRRILRGKNTAMTRNHHIARLHEVKQSIYHLIYKLSSEARTCDADFEVRNEMVPLVFSALVDLRELDESLEDSNDHVKWLILTLSNLVSDLPVECSEQLAVRWDELAIDEILKGAFNQFVYVPETDSSTKVCHAAIKILHSWLKFRKITRRRGKEGRDLEFLRN
ncbi:hypothetical protein BC829DRAFT_222041 [Chytridium lagenaria]|nr:hypothetical protein BC829DRAFT_222041 [Chytridium lagenaria]